MKFLICVIALLSIALVGGCQKAPNLAGTWTGSSGSGGAGSLTLKEDKTFSMELAPGQSMTGKWDVSGTSVKLSPEMIAGKTKADALKEIDEQIKKTPQLKDFLEPIKKLLNEMNLTLAEDGKTMTMTTTVNNKSETVTFKKEEKK